MDAWLARLVKLVPAEIVAVYLAGRPLAQERYAGGWPVVCLVLLVIVRAWGTSDRRGPAPSGQERGVDVDRSHPRDGKNRPGDDLAEGHHHQQFGRERANALDSLLVANPLRLVDRQFELPSGDLDRWRRHLHPVAGAVWLSDHEQDVVPRGVQRSQ